MREDSLSNVPLLGSPASSPPRSRSSPYASRDIMSRYGFHDASDSLNLKSFASFKASFDDEEHMKIFRDSAVASLRRSASKDKDKISEPKLNNCYSSSSTTASVTPFDRKFQFLTLDSVKLRGASMLRSNSVRTKTWILRHTGTEAWESVKMECLIAKEIPWFEHYCHIEQHDSSSNIVHPDSKIIVSVTFYVPKSRHASSLRIPFRLKNQDGKYFGPPLLLEGILSEKQNGPRMMPKKKYGYKVDVLFMLLRLAVVANKKIGIYKNAMLKLVSKEEIERKLEHNVKDWLEKSTAQSFLRKLGSSLQYQLCMIPESFQISMMNTTQQFLMIGKNRKDREMKFQNHKRIYGGSRWMFKFYDENPESWIFDLTTERRPEGMIVPLPTFSYSLSRRGKMSNSFRVVALCEVVDSNEKLKRCVVDVENDDGETDKIETWIVPPELYLDRMLFVYNGDYFEGCVDETSTFLFLTLQCISLSLSLSLD